MRIRGEDGLLQRVVFELRYRFGFSFLDSCGSTLNSIQKTHSEWILRGETPNPQGAPLVSLDNGCVFNFSSNKMDFSLEKPVGDGTLTDSDFKHFLEQTDAVSAIVIDRLGLRDFSRIGVRCWYLFGKGTKEESEKWLLDLGLYSFADSFVKAFAGTMDSAGVSIVLSGSKAKYRLAFNGVEQQAQFDFGQGLLNIPAHSLGSGQKEHLKKQLEVKKRMRQNPEYASMIDIDCFVEDPTEIDPAAYIRESVSEYTKALGAMTDRAGGGR